MYTVKLSFRDENQPKMVEKCATIEQAQMQAIQWLNQFAGVKGVYIKRPDYKTDVYDSRGEYLFTVPEL